GGGHRRGVRPGGHRGGRHRGRRRHRDPRPRDDRGLHPAGRRPLQAGRRRPRGPARARAGEHPARRPRRCRSGGRGRARAPRPQDRGVRGPGQGLRTGDHLRVEHLVAVDHRAVGAHRAPVAGRRHALLQPGPGAGADRGGAHGGHRPRGARRRHRAGGPAGQEPGGVRRPRGLHRQQPALHLPQPGRRDVRVPLRRTRGPRRRHALRLRLPHGPAGADGPHRPRHGLRDPRHDVPAVAQPAPRAGPDPQADDHRGAARPEVGPRLLHLRRPRVPRGRGRLADPAAARPGGRRPAIGAGRGRRRHRHDGHGHRRGVRQVGPRRGRPRAHRGQGRGRRRGHPQVAREGRGQGQALGGRPRRDPRARPAHDLVRRPGDLRPGGRGRRRGPRGQAGRLRRARRRVQARRDPRDHHVVAARGRVRRGDAASRRRHRHALLQPGVGDEARRDRQPDHDLAGRHRHRPGRDRRDRQAPGAVRRPRGLHRQRAAVPLPQRRDGDARGELRQRRRHRLGHEERLRAADGAVRAARRRRARRVAGHRALALPGVPRARFRAGAAARAPGDRRPPGPQDRPGLPGLPEEV
ncbi:MAG: 3-hydroxybutyryl-CoA dehydrogenase; 3-hydroxyacyl-CoA dehydrogenase, partial [uncultured Actinomycetospora sp.]